MRHANRQAVALAGLLALVAVNPGCSFLFMEATPTDHAKLAYFDCTSTYGLPVADGVFGLSGAIGAVTTLRQSKQEFADKNNGASRNVAAGADLVVAGLLAASAAYGVVQATRCDRAKEALKARILAPALRPPDPVPAPLPPAPPAPPPPPGVPSDASRSGSPMP